METPYLLSPRPYKEWFDGADPAGWCWAADRAAEGHPCEAAGRAADRAMPYLDIKVQKVQAHLDLRYESHTRPA